MSDALEQFLNKKSGRAEEWKETIEDMLNNWDRYGYAESTLIGILDYIDENSDITDAQIQAIENIKNKPNHHYGR